MGKKVFTNIVWMLTTGVSCALGAAVYSAISWWEQVNFQWDDDEVRFVLDQHAYLCF